VAARIVHRDDLEEVWQSNYRSA